MNLHEYQGKLILAKYNVPVPAGYVADSLDEAVEAAQDVQKEKDTKQWVVKAQVHAGGRGKGGGIKLARSLDEVREVADKILGMRLVTPQTGEKGKLVRKILIQEDIYYEGPSEIKEYYVGVLLNKKTGHNMIMYSPQGGVDIEKVAEETPHLIYTEEIDPRFGIKPYQCRKIAYNLNLHGQAFKEMLRFINGLYNAHIGSDASLIEINPVIKSSDEKIFAVDCKVNIDNNALFRHPEIANMRDFEEEDPIEVEASKYDLSYVKMDGNVGCMVNGAGLAMATMDIIKLSGGEPANFLDVGGTASAKRVEEAFSIILQDPGVEAILINIFGGIVRCDRVAQGIVDFYKSKGKIDLPVIVRLQGTNADEAKQLIDNSGLEVHSAIKLEEAAELVSKLVGKKEI